MSNDTRYDENNGVVDSASSEADLQETESHEQEKDDEQPLATAQKNMENLAGNVAATVGGALGEAQNAVTSGISAVREVRYAAKAHADARHQIQEMRTVLTSDKEQLEHRLYVHENYDGIVSEQTAIITESTQEMQRQKNTVDSLTQHHTDLQKQLETILGEDEQNLRPYRNLSETAKGRLDDVARTVTEAKRAIKMAEAQVKDATDRRDQACASAQRALDNSHERQHKLLEELTELKKDPAANNSAISRVQNDIASEKIRESEAQASLASITEQAKSAIEIAQTHLWTQKKSLESAQSATDAAHSAYEERKNEFERLQTEARARERIAQNNLTAVEENIKQAQDAFDAAAQRHDDALALLEDARAIQASPEETEHLKGSVSSQLSAVEQKQDEIEKLAHVEKTLRVTTRKQRLALLAVIAGFVILVILLIWRILN